LNVGWFLNVGVDGDVGGDVGDVFFFYVCGDVGDVFFFYVCGVGGDVGGDVGGVSMSL